MMADVRPEGAKELIIFIWENAFALVSNTRPEYPGRCPGLVAAGLPGRLFQMCIKSSEMGGEWLRQKTGRRFTSTNVALI